MYLAGDSSEKIAKKLASVIGKVVNGNPRTETLPKN